MEANAQKGFRPPLFWLLAGVRFSPISIACLLFVLTMAAVVVSMSADVNLYDEAIILVGSQRVLAGDIPHRDFYANYGPGQFVIIAALFKLFGSYVIVARGWGVFVRAAIVSIVYLLTCRESRLVGLAAAIFSAYWVITFDNYLYPQFPAACACLASLAFLRPALEGRAAPERVVAAGFMAAIAAMFMYEIGAATIAVECFGFVAVVQFRHRELYISISRYVAGACLVLVPYVVWLVINGALSGFVLDIFTLAIGGYAAMRRLPLPSLSQHWFLCSYQPLIVLATCIPTLLLLSRHSAQVRRDFAFPAMVGLLTLVFVAKGWVRIDPIHMSGAILCSIVLLALAFARSSSAGRLAKMPLLAAAALSLLFALPSIRQPLRAARANYSRLSSAHLCQPQPGAERVVCLQVAPEEGAASLLARELTQPTEAVFIGDGRHDKIFVSNVLLYFLIDRPVATAWHQMDPGVQTTAAVQQQIVDELRRKCVRVVVLDTQWDDQNEPNGSAISSGVTLLDDMIRHDYVAVRSFGTLTVMQERSEVHRPQCPEAAAALPTAGPANQAAVASRT